jgi:hypothetical protein
MGVSQSELSKPPARAVSPDFSNSDNTVSSTVGYRATSAEQKAAFNLYASPKTPGCLTTAVGALINDRIKHPPTGSTLPPEVTVGQSTVNQMSFPPYGDQSIAYQVKIPVTASGLSISVYVDEIVVIKGRADVAMSFQGSPSPVPTDQEQHYTDLVVGRLTNT